MQGQLDPGATEPLPPAAARRLYREPDDRKLFGVCAGVADYFGLDPAIVRIATVVLSLGVGPGVIAYLVAALVIPRRPPDVPRQIAPPATLPIGISANNGLLIAVVALAALVMFDGRWWIFNAPALGLALVGVGVWLLVSRDREQEQEAGPALTTWSAASTTLVGETASERDQIDGMPATADLSVESDDSADLRGEVPPPVPPRGSPSSRTALIALLLIAGGILSLLMVVGVWDLGFEEAVGAALVLIGAVLVLGAWHGRIRWAIGLGLVAVAVLVVAEAINVPLDAGSGDRRLEASSLAELNRFGHHHELLAGELALDLDQAPLDQLSSTYSLDAEVGFGQLNVYLPEDATVDMDIDVDMGNMEINGPGPVKRPGLDRPVLEEPNQQDESGVDIDRRIHLDGQEGGGRIHLDLHVGFGEVRVFHG
ncbi:MAG TPA: PspC domain-containing protein [Acidimicrobiales bacterium]|jgi:phage shock protein PspC (stress-responsive transcriptional regulator)